MVVDELGDDVCARRSEAFGGLGGERFDTSRRCR
jgi:hypothetical protein